ncbi:MAG: tyrosine--tRNA ligase, partial [Firmicutes bacterium]|nr:tyrosine--tRNA ligase [Bacillota bacterium]
MEQEQQLTPEQERRLEEQLAVIRRGTSEMIPAADLEKKVRKSLQTGKPLKVKLGLDPSAP